MEDQMATKTLFTNSGVSKRSPAADTVNEAGGRAYAMKPKSALAQLAVTGCFNQTFYASGQDQMDKVLDLVTKVDPEFVGKVAVYARERGFMKDMPAFLITWLVGQMSAAHQDVETAPKEGKAAAQARANQLREIVWDVFPRVIDNGKMLRNFVQMIRSGTTGRKSLGTAPRRLIRQWFETKTDNDIFFNSTGNAPSLADVVKLAHPCPNTAERAALYAYLIGKDKTTFENKEIVVAEHLPEKVKEYETFKVHTSGTIPKVPYEMLEGITLSPSQWKDFALQVTWQQLRQHLNSFQKHGVFEDKKVLKLVADKIRDEAAIKKAKVMPYQLMVSYLNMASDMPVAITNALQDAMEIATHNVPKIDGIVCVLPDISGSMHSPLTGHRVGATTKVRCIDVAALVAASMLRVNPETVVIPFESKALTDVRLNPRDSVMTNAEKLRNLPCGGTNCAAALEAVNKLGIKPALVWYVSDNESWLDSPRYGAYSGNRSTWSLFGGGGATAPARTATLTEWDKLLKRSPKAKLVCMDVQPYDTTQVPDREEILNIGGFSDACFDVVSAFTSGDKTHWVELIEKFK